MYNLCDKYFYNKIFYLNINELALYLNMFKYAGSKCHEISPEIED